MIEFRFLSQQLFWGGDLTKWKQQVIPFLALAQVFNLKTDNIKEDALAKKYDEADNNNDAAALAALFTEDAVIVPETGPVNGREDFQALCRELLCLRALHTGRCLIGKELLIP